MPRGTTVDRSNFEKLLGWIGENEAEAGAAYESLRLRLIKIFYARGCQTAEELADETIDRVTNKIDSVANTYEGDPRLYFYGVAKNVFREHLRKPPMNELPINLTKQSSNHHAEKLERQDRCLSECMDMLPDGDQKFILSYYEGEKSVKIQNRQRLMEELELTPQALRVKAFRIRAKLQQCVFRCLELKST